VAYRILTVFTKSRNIQDGKFILFILHTPVSSPIFVTHAGIFICRVPRCFFVILATLLGLHNKMKAHLAAYLCLQIDDVRRNSKHQRVLLDITGCNRGFSSGFLSKIVGNAVHRVSTHVDDGGPAAQLFVAPRLTLPSTKSVP
jgi:hypothetical protein